MFLEPISFPSALEHPKLLASHAVNTPEDVDCVFQHFLYTVVGEGVNHEAHLDNKCIERALDTASCDYNTNDELGILSLSNMDPTLTLSPTTSYPSPSLIVPDLPIEQYKEQSKILQKRKSALSFTPLVAHKRIRQSRSLALAKKILQQ
ncbi:hypothetical protein BCV72DRAFT_15788 [Rhizopus microsporus var. microsporus]|uniref:Uncharacterized protein n=1 Tax=Rhizopus microsporus var. microsporus TaxID=86635 RepID=A0A1X0REX2_RHIZD|nr:hypothetical protein BCV72DRAFT_15788 [Rhizopus microsporus var. microsporus]